MPGNTRSTEPKSFVEIGPLSANDKLLLMEQVGRQSLSFENRPIGGARAGEPVTIAVIILSQLALTGLAAFLVQTRKSQKMKVGYIKIETPHASLELRDFEFEAKSQEEPKDALIRALKGSLNEVFDAKDGE